MKITDDSRDNRADLYEEERYRKEPTQKRPNLEDKIRSFTIDLPLEIEATLEDHRVILTGRGEWVAGGEIRFTFGGPGENKTEGRIYAERHNR